MSNQTNLMRTKVTWGLFYLAAGLIVAVAGVLLPLLLGDLGFNERIITAVGILLVGIGVANLVQYATMRRDPKAARQMAIEKGDERLALIRGRAGHRAFWVSTALAYALLMWLSFASSGSLPVLSPDALWFCLAAVVVVPFIVYASGIVYEQNRL